MLLSVYRDEPVAVVDAYGAGQFLGPALRARGVHPVHVANKLCDWPALTATFNPYDFVSCLEYEGDLEATARELRVQGVRHVLAGTESGSEVADQLGHLIGTATTNRRQTAAARRDKRDMHRLASEADVEVPWQQHLDASGRQTWRTAGAEPKEVVIKPPRSAGTNLVFRGSGAEQVKRAVESVLLGTTIYGEPNDGVVIQEYLEGAEYMINSVSAAGRHAFIETWTSEKLSIDGSIVYDRQRLVDPSDKDAETIRNYVARTLDALGILWGPAHTEIIVTTRGPRLLEVATRMPGGADPALSLRAVATNQVIETVDALLAPHVFSERGAVRAIHCHAMGISLISPRGGILAREVDLRPIKSLASYHGIKANLNVGTPIRRTTDLLTKPGGLYLCHEDPRQLECDYQRVRAWEESELQRAIDPGTGDSDE